MALCLVPVLLNCFLSCQRFYHVLYFSLPVLQNGVMVKTLNEGGEGVSGTTSPSALASAVTHACDVCGKMFPFRYQLIVHRRYHTERKPFTCQVGIFLLKPLYIIILMFV